MEPQRVAATRTNTRQQLNAGTMRLISAVAGLLAAILLALRAGRMNILDAIAHE